MSKYGLAFDGSKGRAFVQSPALERNAQTSRTTLRAWAYTVPSLFQLTGGGVFSSLRERLAHELNFNHHVHTSVCQSDCVFGGPGNEENVGFSIPTSGLSRVFVRVRGVAPLVPNKTIQMQAGAFNLTRVPASFRFNVSSGSVYISNNKLRFSISPVSDFSMGNEIALRDIVSTRLIANLGAEDADISETPVVINRIIAFTVQGPFSMSFARPEWSWNWFSTASSVAAPFWDGGSTTPQTQLSGRLTDPSNASFAGSNVFQQTTVPSYNPGTNTTNLDGNQLFTDPTNRIELNARLLGWRPVTSASPEEFLDLE